MNYNDFTYYRANPYANLGYMPPAAHENRYKSEFLTQIPMGQQHFLMRGKKNSTIVFKNLQQTNKISQKAQKDIHMKIELLLIKATIETQIQQILKVLQEATHISQAVRNKMIARQQLIKRRQNDKNSNSSRIEILLNGSTYQQQKRKKIAQQQFLRDQQLLQVRNNRMKSENNNKKTYFFNEKQRETTKKEKTDSTQDNQEIRFYQKRIKRKELQDQYLPRYHSIDLSSVGNNHNCSRKNSHLSSEADQFKSQSKQKRKTINSQHIQTGPSTEQRHFDKGNEQKITQEVSNNLKKTQNQPKQIIFTDRKTLRSQNPTYLSSQGPIHFAALNIMKNI